MDTPWGPLRNLDAHDWDLAWRIISTDKDTLVEGLIVENAFDQILRPLSVSPEAALTVLDIETIIVSHQEQRLAFVWARSRQAGLGRYLRALARGMSVYLVEFHDGDFFATPFRETSLDRDARRPLTQLAAQLSGQVPKLRKISLSVRDAGRMKSIYWGFLTEAYKQNLWSKVILARLLINHGISPYFNHVWNLDRVCLYRDKLWLLEVKHKFPMRNMNFGINQGEVQNIAMLYELGIECVYALFVNPVRERGQNAMYLYNDRGLQEHVAVIATDLGSKARALLNTKAGSAPPHTSLGGTTIVPFYSLRPSSFSYLGNFAEVPKRLGERLCAALDGKKFQAVDNMLLDELSSNARSARS